MAVRKGTFKVKNPGTGAMDEVMLKTNVEQVEGLADNTANAINKSLDEFLVGMIFPYAGKDIPAGFLLCNGAAISRTTYARLYAKIGTLYGAGDGSTTFNLPNLIERFVEGGDSSTAGRFMQAGLPDAIGFIDCRSYVTNGGTTIRGGGVFSETQYVRGDALIAGTSIPSNVEQAQNELQFSLSRYNGIYGTASTVQPAALHCQYLIKY